jgi:Resolvase, N terminal domain
MYTKKAYATRPGRRAYGWSLSITQQDAYDSALAADLSLARGARVSTTDQDLSIQEVALRAAGCDIIRAEKRSGTTMEGPAELRTVLEFLEPGDTLVVTRIDRLWRRRRLRFREFPRSAFPPG